MKFIPTEIPDVVLIEPKVFKDDRGFFLESYSRKKFEEAGIPVEFVQDNHSRSVKGTLRGLHAQVRSPQGKLVRVLEGEVLDVAVDIRRGSPTFGKWVGRRLSAENFLQLYVPVGFLHGFCALTETVQFSYKCTDFYDPEGEIGVRWDDPEIGIEWPVTEPVLSKKDAAYPALSELLDRLPVYRGSLG